MLMRILGQTETENFSHKRKYERRESDQCVAEIGGKTYPVMNWSKGGALIFMDDRLFAENDNLDVMMKFHIQDRIVPINNLARVIRKSDHRVAIEFQAVDDKTQQQFQMIIDDIAAREFTDSQI